jgi:hypothetical protein
VPGLGQSGSSSALAGEAVLYDYKGYDHNGLPRCAAY